MAYAKRTCHKCGMIKPVNYMQKKTIKRKTGSSSEKLTAGTMVGFLLENPSSKRRVNKRIFANNKRGYVRNKDVWQCNSGQCHMTVKQIGSGATQGRARNTNTDEPEATPGEVLIGMAILTIGGLFSLWLLGVILRWLF